MNCLLKKKRCIRIVAVTILLSNVGAVVVAKNQEEFVVEKKTLEMKLFVWLWYTSLVMLE